MNPKDSPTDPFDSAMDKLANDSRRVTRYPLASERAEGPADERIDGVLKTIADGFSLHGYRQGTKECVAFHRGIEYARSRLAAATPVVPPSGWKLVPIEPTKEMCIAAVKFANGNAVYKNVAPAALEIEEGIYGETYAAMLATSPSPRTPEQPEQPEQQVSYTNLMSDSVTVNPVECSGTRPAAADDGRDTRAAIQRGGPINPRTNRPWSLADPEVQPLLEAHKEEMRDPVKARAFLTQTGILGPTGRLAKRFGGDD